MATSSGDYERRYNWDNEQRCNCPTKYGPYTADSSSYTDIYTAVCQSTIWITANNYNKFFNNSNSADWVRSHTCPKGWGKYHAADTDKPYVQCAQGYVVDGDSEPVYGYVTRYRDAWYDFYSTRVAKI